MAEEDSTSTDSAVDAVDTSVNGDDTSTDNDEDVDLEDIEVDPEDMDSNDDPETEEETESEEADTDDEPSEDDAESSDSEDPELSDEQRQAAQNKEMFERRQQEKQARIARVKQDQANYIAEASENRDPLELAVRQLQVSEYNNTVDAVSNRLTNSYERALNDFPVLKTADPVIQAEIDREIDAFQALNVNIDPYGNPTEVRGDLYATLQAKADSIEKLTGIRAANQTKSKTKEKSKTLVTPGRAPREPKKDADIAAFDEEAWS